MVENVSGYKIKVINQSYTDFLSQLQADLILTPTRRLATRLNRDYAQLQITQQKNVWHTDIISLNGWLERLWQTYQDDIHHPQPMRLNAWQNQLVWQEMIDASELTPLLRKESTARLAQQAWTLLKEWNIPFESIASDAVSADIQVFLTICARYQQHCHANNQCDAASMLHLLSSALPQGIQKIYLIGFTDIKPAVKTLLEIMRTNGAVIEVLEYRTNAKVYCAPQIDAKTELVQAALWAKALLAEQPQAPIGVIIPDLAQRFNEVDGIFSSILMPQTLLANHYHDQKPYNISSGNRLTDFPVIAIIFELLKFNSNKMPVHNLSKILLSPFIRGGITEHLQRARMDFENKQSGIEYVSPLWAIANVHRTTEGELLPSKWSSHIKQILNNWGWPGERVLNSLEYQVVQRFYELLNDFSTLDSVQKPLSYYGAQSLLYQQAQTVLFQGESENAPLQILGALEGEGLYFHALWVSGLHHENWPQACAPHPFLPIDLQREKYMPHASSEREYIFASHLTKRFTEQAQRVILSYPQQENDKALMPSALIRDYPILNTALDPYAIALYDQNLHLESWQDVQVPLRPDQKITGGVGLLQSQSVCPFQAFARFRLHAKTPEPAQTGLSYAQRGELVHSALEFFWQKIKTSNALLKLPENELKSIVEQAIHDALNKLPRQALSKMHLQLEQQRLQQLLIEWLTLEKKRPSFSVIDTEKSIEIHVSKLKLHARIDRIDQLASGEILLIDYKTGQVNKPNWLDTRPTQVQLPLYATHYAATQGVAFAKVKANEHQWIELFAHQSANEFNMPWSELLQHWSQTLSALADEFYQGHAVVSPLEGAQTCRYCNLELLCRIRS